MVEIGGMPILLHILKIYAAYGITEFVICLGYRGYMIKEYFANYFLHSSDITIHLNEEGNRVIHRSAAEPWTITMVDTGANTMTGGRLKRIRSYLNPGEAFLMTYGDGVADINIRSLIEFHRKHGKMATLDGSPARSALWRLGFGKRPPVRAFREKPCGKRLCQWRFFCLGASGFGQDRWGCDLLGAGAPFGLGC